MNTRRTHIVIPEPLVDEIDRLVGKRRRSEFITRAAEKELQRLRQINALRAAVGAWQDKDHPELTKGAASWVRELRRETEKPVRRSGR